MRAICDIQRINFKSQWPTNFEIQEKAKNSATHLSYGQVDFHNMLWSILNMLIERPHAIQYLITIVMFDLFITVCEIFKVEMCMTLTLTYKMGQD